MLSRLSFIGRRLYLSEKLLRGKERHFRSLIILLVASNNAVSTYTLGCLNHYCVLIIGGRRSDRAVTVYRICVLDIEQNKQLVEYLTRCAFAVQVLPHKIVDVGKGLRRDNALDILIGHGVHELHCVGAERLALLQDINDNAGIKNSSTMARSAPAHSQLPLQNGI